MSCAAERVDLLAFGRAELAAHLASGGVARGHADALWRSLHRDGLTELAQIAGLSERAARRLAESARIGNLELVRETSADDGLTRK